MRNLAFILLSLIFALLVPGLAMASETGVEANPRWSDCRSDDECVEVNMPCGRGAVNRQFLSEVRSYYANRAFEALECATRDTSTGGHIICDRYVQCDSDAGKCANQIGVCKILVPHRS